MMLFSVNDDHLLKDDHHLNSIKQPHKLINKKMKLSSTFKMSSCNIKYYLFLICLIFNLIVPSLTSNVRSTKSYDFKETDGSSTGFIMFNLDKIHPSEVFKIESPNKWVTVDSTGAVRVNEPWDYESLGKEKTIDFWTIITSPNLSEPDRQRIIIHIKDVNDEQPYFINRPLPMQTVVQLNAPAGTPVFKLQVRDPDTDHNIHYFMVRDRTGGRFEVDERSGEVRTKGNEKFVLDKEYVLYVKAEDHNGPTGDRSFQSTKEERLSIVGGKRPPQFYMPKYEATIPETQKKDSEIIEVKAKSFADREIRYSLKAQGKGAGTFFIGEQSGVVKLIKDLDYEDLRQPKLYSLIVTATENTGGFSTSVELAIKVTDANDNLPKFELPDYQAYNIDEDVPIGTKILQVKATDMDHGKNAEIVYSLNRDEFYIDENGVIYSNKRLDADNNNTYQFTVSATDKGDPPLTGTATVRIYTENKNDEPPKFSQDVYTPNIDESAGPGTLVTTITASDMDGDNILYGFVGGGTISGMFQIEERTGVIRLINDKIHLDKDKYELNVTARDDGSCCKNGQMTTHTSTALVVVFITVNDNKPVFENCATYRGQVEEGAPANTKVLIVQATDLDKGLNGQVRYSVVQQPNQKGTKFIVDELTGEVKTNKVFDREGEDGRFVSVTVKAVDRGSPALEGVCSFKVEILDVNDNSPLFDRQEYKENVKQDTPIGTNILRVSASDEDSDLNGAIMYSLSAPVDQGDIHYFSINQDSGWISLKRPLDKAQYQLRASASDRGDPIHTATVEVSIDVVDRANMPPSWDKPTYGPIPVKENIQVGQRVISIKAQSGIPENPTVFYTLIRGSTEQTNKLNTFYLTHRAEGNTTWCDIFVNYALDYEHLQQYNLTVRVENNGVQQLASETTVHIILEVNDEIPLFIEKVQETVLEGMPIGTKVTQVEAIDHDGTYPNSKVFYSIEPQPDGSDRFFSIDRESGEIHTKMEFDREEKQAYALLVKAYDGAPSDRPNMKPGQPNWDKNDNPPYFQQDIYEAEVNEDEDIQHVVITVTAKDKDESSKIRYEITEGNYRGAFAVKNETGAIYVAGPLDYETRKEYKLRLTASDNLNENHTYVLIKVKDVNDNPPAFERPKYEAQITEEDDRNLPKKILQYNLTLVASDTLHENKTLVRIKVKDVNDLPPVFSKQQYEATIMEEDDKNLPKKILQVLAKDGDIDRPQNIVYFLTGQGVDDRDPKKSKFSINSTSGEIYVLKPLDRDLPHGRSQWRFTCFAEDEGGNGLVGYSDILINLRVNDNAPFFSSSIYVGNVTENGTAGMVVMSMQATDYDDPMEGSNAKLKYSIEQNQVNEHGELIFSIDEDTGVITTAVCCLDREQNPEFTIKVAAVDGGGLKGTGTALIKIKDINDQSPEFTKKEWFVEVDETDGDQIPDLPILVVSVNDGDLLETNRFNYKVVEKQFGSDKFTMITNVQDGTGSLKVAKPLDYEDLQQRYGFNITIMVSDNGLETNDPSHVDYAKVNIRLRDINDNKPEFERPNIEVQVLENSTIGTQLATFHATDIDAGGKSKVSYYIDRNSDRKRQFKINQDGVVTIQRKLDRETQPRHTIKIVGVDDGYPSKSSTATLTVVVGDINDNPPRFLYDYRPVIMEKSPPQKVVEILATDDDDRSKGNAAPYTFAMSDQAPEIIKRLFTVQYDHRGANGDGSCILYSNATFDRETQKEYQIPIVIKDNGNPSLAATSILTVVIGDLNDNKMQPGSKTIFVNCLKGDQYSQIDAEIGKVHVEDADDWDTPDKTFRWYDDFQKPEKFEVDYKTGIIRMKNITAGEYHLNFIVHDKKYSNEVNANVTVIVKEIPEEAVRNSGSIRVSGVTAEDIIRVWSWKKQRQHASMYEMFKNMLMNITRVKNKDNIDIFSVITKSHRPPVTDIRFSVHGSPYYKPVYLDGTVALNRDLILEKIGLNITMVGIDECMNENTCDGSCSNELVINNKPLMVNANRTAFVGIDVSVKAQCTCAAKDFSKIETCRSNPSPCLNGGKCIDSGVGPICKCPEQFDGPRCEVSTRSFTTGKGWAWFEPLQSLSGQCEESHLSLEFMTKNADGLILYNGPIAKPDDGLQVEQDFISLELIKGYARLLIDFGSGTKELTVRPLGDLHNGEWHIIDIFWDKETVRMMIDRCVGVLNENPSNVNPASDSYLHFDRSKCENKTDIQPFNEFLNVNAPLQLGGYMTTSASVNLHHYFNWRYRPQSSGFVGCIKNVIHNSIMYDLGSPGSAIDSTIGCQPADDSCMMNSITRNCGPEGTCIGSYSKAYCLCKPGWSGTRCNKRTQTKMFHQSSYNKYALSFSPNTYRNEIQVMFRTRERSGELIRAMGSRSREHLVLEIKDKKLRFRYKLSSTKTNEERILTLPDVIVTDGQFHVVNVKRYGSLSTISLDGGVGRRYNEIMEFGERTPQLIQIDKQNFFAGGEVQFVGPGITIVENDYQEGCMNDIRFDQKSIPMENGSENAAVVEWRNLVDGCPSNNPCQGRQCSKPFVCSDRWRQYECVCPAGFQNVPDRSECVDKNECIWQPCGHRGKCINLEHGLTYQCECEGGYTCTNCTCDNLGEWGPGNSIIFGRQAMTAIILAILAYLILVLVIITYSRNRKPGQKFGHGDIDDDVRENIINYADEGGGEDDMNAFDITPLRIPVDSNTLMNKQTMIKDLRQRQLHNGDPDMAEFIKEHLEKASNDPSACPFDDLRKYAYEGCGSTTGSLSSLASANEENEEQFDWNQFLGNYGPRFSKIKSLYHSNQQN